MQLKVQSASIADRLAEVVASPQGGVHRRAVRAVDAVSSVIWCLLVGLDRRPVGAVHFRVQSAGVAQVVALGGAEMKIRELAIRTMSSKEIRFMVL